MKASKTFFITLAFTAVASMVMSCREITTTTKISSDGSAMRTVQVKSSHATHTDSYFPIPNDGNWTITNEKVKSDSSTYEYTATRTFTDVESLQSFYTGYADSGAVRISIELKKRYGLFFRYFRYEEVYGAYTPYTKVPIGDYLTKEEIEIYLAEPDSSEMEEKVDQWRMHAIFEEFYQGILAKAQSLENLELSKQKLGTKKDTIFAAIIEESDSTEDILQALSAILHTDAVYALRDTVDALLHTIENDFDVIMQVGTNDYINRVIMPGLLLDTNADAIEGNMAQWDFPGDVFEFQNKVMWVESRMVNWWGTGISAGILTILILLLIVIRIRKKVT